MQIRNFEELLGNLIWQAYQAGLNNEPLGLDPYMDAKRALLDYFNEIISD